MWLTTAVCGDVMIWASYMLLGGWCGWVASAMHGRVKVVGLCFSAFIASCGITHLAGAWAATHGFCETGWWLSALVKIETAFISIATAMLVWWLSWKNRSRTIDLGGDKTWSQIATMKEDLAVLEARQHLMEAAKKFLETVI